MKTFLAIALIALLSGCVAPAPSRLPFNPRITRWSIDNHIKAPPKGLIFVSCSPAPFSETREVREARHARIRGLIAGLLKSDLRLAAYGRHDYDVHYHYSVTPNTHDGGFSHEFTVEIYKTEASIRGETIECQFKEAKGEPIWSAKAWKESSPTSDPSMLFDDFLLEVFRDFPCRSGKYDDSKLPWEQS